MANCDRLKMTHKNIHSRNITKTQRTVLNIGSTQKGVFVKYPDYSLDKVSDSTKQTVSHRTPHKCKIRYFFIDELLYFEYSQKPWSFDLNAPIRKDFEVEP